MVDVCKACGHSCVRGSKEAAVPEPQGHDCLPEGGQGAEHPSLCHQRDAVLALVPTGANLSHISFSALSGW